MNFGRLRDIQRQIRPFTHHLKKYDLARKCTNCRGNHTAILDRLVYATLEYRPVRETQAKQRQTQTSNKKICKARVNNIMLKKLSKESYKIILHIFNDMVTLEYYPKAWKNSIIIMLSKPSKNTTSVLLSCRQ